MTSAAQDSVPTADEAFGLVVHETLFKKRMTQVKLAAALGITQAAVSKKLKGQRPWTLTDQIAAADALREDLRDLLTQMWRDDPGTASFKAGGRQWNSADRLPTTTQQSDDDEQLPRLDSNQQHFDYKANGLGRVIDLDAMRRRRDELVKTA